MTYLYNCYGLDPVDSDTPTMFHISEHGDLLWWFDCADYMRKPTDIAMGGRKFYVCDFKVRSFNISIVILVMDNNVFQGCSEVVFTKDGVFVKGIGCENITNFFKGFVKLKFGSPHHFLVMPSLRNSLRLLHEEILLAAVIGLLEHVEGKLRSYESSKLRSYLLLSGDIESNPGPPRYAFNDIFLCSLHFFSRTQVVAGVEMEKRIKIDDKDSTAINYFRQISENRDKHCFLSPFGGVILKGCDQVGDLYEFRNIGDYERLFKEKKLKMSMWLYLKLKLFKIEGSGLEMFGIFVCPQCDIMTGVMELQVSQDPMNILPQLCFHSQVASMMTGNWREEWTTSTSLSFDRISVISNEESNYIKFVSKSSSFPFLAAVLENNVVYLLFCATTKQETPFCSVCVRRKCHHFKKLLDYFDAIAQGNVDTDDPTDNDYEPLPEIEEQDMTYNDHYLKLPPNHVRGRLYGHNFKAITYPFCDSPHQQQLWLERMSGVVNLPDQLVPEFEETNECKHNEAYSSHDEDLVRESENLCLFNELGQRIFSTKVFSRPTVGSCKCLQRYDGHELMIWHLGKGRFVDYTLLLSYLHKWRASGISMYAMFRSIVDTAESCGVTSSLKYPDIHRSICGFFCNIQFDVLKAFSCPNHGTSPRWIVADGKALGPLKRRVEHLMEFDIADDDDMVLEQSTHYKDRIFMNINKERKIVLQLLTGLMTMEEFSLSEEIRSENGLLVKSLVVHINCKFPTEIPEPYVSFLSNISKNSSARSLMQVTELEALDILGDFCREELNIRILENRQKMSILIKTLPALWPLLDSICSIENSNYLPRQVSKIVIQMLKIRLLTFQNATRRSNTDVYRWQDPTMEHPTQCYPTLPIWRYPSKYKVSDQVDTDLCEKTFTYHGDFTAGVFSVGCACSANVTLGFELMLAKESPRNLFRFLITRDVNLEALEGILVDFGCLFEPYVMNREANMLEKIHVLVDGSHWAGHKSLKKGDKSGKGGHSG